MRWNFSILVFAFFAVIAAARAQDCSPPDYKPIDGPLFDAMAQTGQWLNGEAALATAKSVGVTRMALFPRVHKKEDGRSLVDRLAHDHPDFIVTGAPKLFDMRRDLDDSYVNLVLNGVAERHYAFVGEILYTHGNKAGGEIVAGGERYIDPIKPQTTRLVEGLKGRNVPIMTHWEVYDWFRDWPKFDKLYAAHPDQIFIWPHLGFGTPEQVATVLASHPNVWATVSKKEKNNANLEDDEKAEDIGGSVSDSCNKLLPEWREVMVKFSDRLMFATDAHMPHRWSNYASVVTQWRGILAQLPPDVATAIAYGNAKKLYGP